MNYKFYIISYDLKASSRDYSALYAAIKNNRDWQHPLESTWLVYTREDATGIYNALKPTLDKNDLIFISELHIQNRQGWMSKTCWEWINNRLV